VRAEARAPASRRRRESWKRRRLEEGAAARVERPTPLGVGNKDYVYCLSFPVRLQLLYIMEI
jgi:hypothetical protein